MKKLLVTVIFSLFLSVFVVFGQNWKSESKLYKVIITVFEKEEIKSYKSLCELKFYPNKLVKVYFTESENTISKAYTAEGKLDFDEMLNFKVDFNLFINNKKLKFELEGSNTSNFLGKITHYNEFMKPLDIITDVSFTELKY